MLLNENNKYTNFYKNLNKKTMDNGGEIYHIFNYKYMHDLEY